MHKETYSDSLAELEEKAASHPDSIEDIHNLADAYADLGRWDAAIKAYQAAIALDPSDADLHNSLGTVYEEVGNLEGAGRAYQQAIVLRPDDSMAYFNLGSLCQAQQRITEAIQNLEKCLQYSTNPDERSAVKAKLALMLPDRKDVVQMYKSVRSWAIGSVLLGGISIVAGGTLDPVWGIVLIVVGAISWRIRIPAMFVIYGVVLAWAAIMNGIVVVTGAGMWWSLLALLQVFWVFRILKGFRKYRDLPLQRLFEAGAWPANLAPPQDEIHITGRFAIAGFTLSVTAGVLVFWGSVAMVVTSGASEPPQLLMWLERGTVGIAVLALGLSGAAALSENARRGWAVAGSVVSGLVLIGWLSLIGLTLLTTDLSLKRDNQEVASKGEIDTTTDPSLMRDNREVAFTSKGDEVLKGDGGETIILKGRGEIYTMNIDGTNLTRITNNEVYNQYRSPDYPDWSPDGQRMAFSGSGEIYVIDANGTNQTRLTDNNFSDLAPDWSPDGQHIAFYSDRDGNGEIYVMNADGTNQTRLTYSDFTDRFPDWSPDGQYIVYYSQFEGKDNYKIYVMNADGSNQVCLTPDEAGDYYPSWSPDGKRIAFTSYQDGKGQIYVMDADGKNRIRLTNNDAWDEYPTWSPDGEFIAFRSNRDNGVRSYVMNADGKNQFALPSNDADWLTWSP